MSEFQEDGARTAETLREVAKAFGVPEVKGEDHFAQLGANSVSLLRLMSALQEKYDITIDLVDIFQARTVAELVVLVENATVR
ncbi:acyl carrier protein [Streptomyces sp. R28]|uniref:Acyl carrier protein n=1 Tax=Streptomyces sp. R28 TaxID=3238628 RepID=A0AB39QAJ0_9ACTN